MKIAACSSITSARLARLTPMPINSRSTADVDGFHAAALAAGVTSESAPSLRPHDRVRYYAAFIVDPDGNRIEAVTFPAE